VSFFTGPLLNWTLVGVVKALAREVHLNGFFAPVHLEVLQTLILSSSCPRPVLALCSPHILMLFTNKKGKAKHLPSEIDVTSVRRVVGEALGFRNKAISPEMHPLGAQCPREEEPRRCIQTALTMARAGKAPTLDVERCIKIISPSKFLFLLWSELVLSASLGEMENCRRIATFVLTMPRSPNTPPLLPIFLFIVSPALIATIDRQQPSEHALNLELFVTVICSAFTAALHLELAIPSVIGGHRFVLGQSSMAMARRFATELREEKSSHTNNTIIQRLASSQPFVANFPVFMNDSM